MTETSLLFEGDSLEGDLETARDCRTSEFMVIPSSLTQSDNKAKKSTVMAAPRSRKSKKPRASWNSRKSELEDQMEERMRASIETRISTFEEKMLGMFSWLQRQNMALLSLSDMATFSLPSVQCNTLGVCQPTDSRLESTKKQRKVLSLENSLNDELLDSSRRALPQQSVLAEELHYTEDDFDLEDVISLQQGQAETKELDLGSQSNLSEHVQEQVQIDDRILNFNYLKTLEKRLNMFCWTGDDACVKKSSSGAGVLLDKAQCDILNVSWRISTPSRLTAYTDSYQNSFPEHERSEEFLKVPSLDDIVEHFLIKRHSGKATFKWARSLFTAHLKEMERLAF